MDPPAPVIVEKKIVGGVGTRPTVFILLPGGWTGDMWACAAATALCQSEWKNVIAAYPVTVISMREGLQENTQGVRLIDASITMGTKTYNYFRSLAIPVLLARINRTEGQLVQYFYGNLIGWGGRKHNYSYLDHMIEAHQRAYHDTEAACADVWSWTRETDSDFNFSTVDLGGHVVPGSLSVELLFPQWASGVKSNPEFRLEDASPPYKFDTVELSGGRFTGPEPCVHLWASTTIVMQYLQDPATRGKRIEYLQQALGGINDKKASWVKDASDLVEQLVVLHKTLAPKTTTKRILIYNYRSGDVNKQHDSNYAMFTWLKRKYGKQYVIVPLVVNAPETDLAEMRRNGHEFVYLYKDGTNYDKRYAAAFWALVASRTNIVFGVIGGRSGSMDIASFMGVNTCSFDEPVLELMYRYDEEYVRKQGGQYLRLISQVAVNSVVYVDVKNDSWFQNGKANGYRKLDVAGFEAWLDRMPNEPHVVPKITARQILDFTCEDTGKGTDLGRKVLETTLLRMEVPKHGIRAVGLEAVVEGLDDLGKKKAFERPN